MAFSRDPSAIAESSGNVISDLVYGWGNADWSGQDEYLRECVKHALVSKGPILECGSGLTTVLLGVIAQRVGTKLWSLEHLPTWGERVRQCLRRYGITSVELCTEPLKNYGGFDWYAAPLASMPIDFALVICDGPPSATRGGRYGLVSVMKRSLAPGCIILLDDAEREQEQAVARRWLLELPSGCERRGVRKPYFVLRRQSKATCNQSPSR